jgi:hypothetical protein
LGLLISVQSCSVESVGIVILDWGHAVLDDGVNHIVGGDSVDLRDNSCWEDSIGRSSEVSFLLSSFGLGIIFVRGWTWSWNPGLGWVESPCGTDFGWVNLSEVSDLSDNAFWEDGVGRPGEVSFLLSSFGLGMIFVGSWTWSWNPGLGWVESPSGTDFGWVNIRSRDLSEVSVLVDGVDGHVPFLLLLSGNSFGKFWVISHTWSWNPSLSWLKSPSGSNGWGSFSLDITLTILGKGDSLSCGQK